MTKTKRTITGEDLGDWQKPFEQIMVHMYAGQSGNRLELPEEHKQKMIEDAYFLKELYTSTGMLVSSANRVIELDNGPDPASHMEFVCRIMGFRGEYRYKKLDESFVRENRRKNIDNMDYGDDIYDLCISRMPTKISEVKMENGSWYIVMSKVSKKLSFSVRAYRYLTASVY